MAKILLGATIGDARNKAGAIVYSKNSFGAYIRTKVSPVQPRTPAQVNVRSLFTLLSKNWGGTLTETERQGWIALAAANPVRDVFGNSQILTGLQMYQRINRNLQTIGQAIVAAAPSSLAVDAPASLAVTATSGGTPALTLTWSPAPATGDYVEIFATPQLGAGKSFVTNFLKFLEAKIGTTTTPFAILTDYTAKYGALISGAKIGFEVIYVGSNGAASAPVRQIVTVT